MGDNYVVTISREYGSGGRDIGSKVAASLGIEVYNKDIILLAAEKSGLSAGFIEKSEESITNSLLFNLNLNVSSLQSYDAVAYYDTPITDKMFLAQCAVIKEVADKGSCVIVGRCADYVLREYPNLIRVFVRAEREDRIARMVEQYALPTGKGKPEDHIKRVDKQRANYYRYYTSQAWGDMNNYDLMINSTSAGIDGSVATVIELIKAKGLV